MSKKAKIPRRSGTEASVEEALRVSQERLGRVVTGMPIVLWSTDANGVFTLSEGKGLELLRLAPGQVVGQSVYEAYRDHPTICEAIRRCLERGEEISLVAEVDSFHFDTRMSPTRDESGVVTGLIGVSVDITERAQMDRALRGLSRRLWSILEEERRGIARELHDEAGQAMTAMKIRLDLARRETDPEKMRAQIEEASRLATGVLDEIRRISNALRPGALEDLGLLPALRALVEDFRHRSGVHTVFHDRNDCPRSDGDAEAAIFRFVQEALANVQQHARAQKVTLEFDHDGERARIRVEDDGAGFEPDRVPPHGHVGLVAMQERAKMLGGFLAVDSRPGAGTRLTLEVPLVPIA